LPAKALRLRPVAALGCARASRHSTRRTDAGNIAHLRGGVRPDASPQAAWLENRHAGIDLDEQ
jgi:hypothetical protein